MGFVSSRGSTHGRLPRVIYTTDCVVQVTFEGCKQDAPTLWPRAWRMKVREREDCGGRQEQLGLGFVEEGLEDGLWEMGGGGALVNAVLETSSQAHENELEKLGCWSSREQKKAARRLRRKADRLIESGLSEDEGNPQALSLAKWLYTKAERIAQCRAHVVVLIHKVHGHPKAVRKRCKERGCPYCGRLNAWIVRRRVEQLATIMVRQDGYVVKAFNTTVPGNPTLTLKEATSAIRQVALRFRRSSLWKALAKAGGGAVCFIETPRNVWSSKKRYPKHAGQWWYHAHMHWIVWVPKSQAHQWVSTDKWGRVQTPEGVPPGPLSPVCEEWGKAVTHVFGDGCDWTGKVRVNVVDPYIPGSSSSSSSERAVYAAVAYATKYASKGVAAKGREDDRTDWVLSSKSVRFFEAFGSDLRALWSATKHVCSCVLLGLLDEVEARNTRQRTRAALTGGDVFGDYCPASLRGKARAASQRAEQLLEGMFQKLELEGAVADSWLKAFWKASASASTLRKEVEEYERDRICALVYEQLSGGLQTASSTRLRTYALAARPRSWEDIKRMHDWVSPRAQYRKEDDPYQALVV